MKGYGYRLPVAVVVAGLLGLAGCHRATVPDASQGSAAAVDVKAAAKTNMLTAVISSNTVTATQPAIITATLATPSGAPVANQTVSFSTQLGNFGNKVFIVTRQTDVAGHATVLLSAGQVPGPGAVIVQYIDPAGVTKRVPLMFKTDGSQKPMVVPTAEKKAGAA